MYLGKLADRNKFSFDHYHHNIFSDAQGLLQRSRMGGNPYLNRTNSSLLHVRREDAHWRHKRVAPLIICDVPGRWLWQTADGRLDLPINLWADEAGRYFVITMPRVDIIRDDPTLEQVVSIQNLLTDCDDLSSFTAKPLQVIAHFLRSDAAAVFSLETQHSDSYSMTARGALDVKVDELHRYLDGFYHHDPIVHASQSPELLGAESKCNLLRLSDIDQKRLANSKYYREFFKDTGISDILAFSLVADDRPRAPTIVAFHRIGKKREFDQKLMERAQLVAPILSSCISRLVLSERLQLLTAATETYSEKSLWKRSVYVFDKHLNCGLRIGENHVDLEFLQMRIKAICEEMSATNLYSSNLVLDGETIAMKDALTVDIKRTVSGIGEHFLVSIAPVLLHGPLSVAARVWQLTARESEVLEKVYTGLRNADIGEVLGIRLKTVENHLSSIFIKSGVRSRTELISKVATRQFG